MKVAVLFDALLKRVEDRFGAVRNELDELSARLKQIPAGKDGAPGQQGERGERGEPGEPGAQGIHGERGERGEKGDTGALGAPGRDGAPGSVGPIGPQGEKGERGAAGENGPPGERGPEGPAGPRGEKGDRGERGEPGETGPHGPVGPSGKDGGVGPRGEKGIDGKDGAPGTNGRDGRDGRDGADGRDALQIEPLPAIDPAKSYPRGTWACHAGGLIRSTRTTDPLLGAQLDKVGWAVIVEGVASVAVEHEERQFGLSVRLTSGAVATKTIKLPVVIDRGVFKEGTQYLAGDGVTFGGSFWIAQKDTTEKPGLGDGFRLAVKRGRDAREPAKLAS